MTDADKEKWLEGAEEYGAPLEDWTKVPVISDESSIDDTMSVPGVQYSANPTITNNAKPQNFVQLHLATLFRKINNMLGTVTEALSDLGLIKTETIAAKDAANAATQAASQATAEAENVNAEITGMTVTITNRQGVSRSVDIGFDIYNVYGSVSAMNADAANVPKGKFVMIATEDPTSPENARLYGRNSNSASSAEPFTFLSDLDQASSSAWADWMENQKPTIERATLNANNTAALANTKAQLANDKATLAETAATNANEKATLAQQKADYAKQQGDYAKNMADHPSYIADGTPEKAGDKYYEYYWDYETQQYVRGSYLKGDDLDYSTITEEEKARLIESVKASLVFAAEETCEDIVSELT